MTHHIHKDESNVASYNKAFPFIIDTAKGPFIYDTKGREYIDFFCGAGANNYGHNPEPLKAALLEYIARDGINNSLDMATVAKQQFIDSFVQNILEPRGMAGYKLQFTGPTGTNAVEAALKLARLATSRSDMISFHRGFHGVSLGALATTSNQYFRDVAGVELDHVHFLDYDDPQVPVDQSVATLRSQFETVIRDHGAPAGAIIECIQGEGGVNEARPEWLQALRELTKAHESLLIVDDIQAGCGRSGTFFSFEPSGIEPDVVTLSKSISGFGSPMSLVLIHPVYDIWKPAQHNGTFRGNNHAFVTAQAAIEQYWTSDKLVSDVARKAAIIRASFESIVAAHPGLHLTIRGRGFLQGLVFEDPSMAADVSKLAFEHGVIIERAGPEDEVVKCMPALTIDDETLQRGLDIVAKAVDDAAKIV
ncbi:MAG: aspartate aminotransferase family protein [Candidatus Saccharimonadales bacterium]